MPLSLPWVRLDTAMPDHPKVLELVDLYGDAGLAAGFVWVCSLAYAGKHGTDGRITRATLARINGKAKHANMLVAVGLWDMEDKGWRVHNYEERNMVGVDLGETFSPSARSNGGKARAASMSPEERSASARRAAAGRWPPKDP